MDPQTYLVGMRTMMELTFQVWIFAQEVVTQKIYGKE